jgi:DNA polymerase-3 subunit epsilon/ATP-dependent DNA helicase DinG
VSTVYVALDVEATGMNPASDRIIEIAAVKFTLDGVLERWGTLVRPGVAIPFAITSLTGITQAHVDRAPPFAAVAPALRAFVRDHPLVGQSIELDLAMIRAAGLPLTNPLVDTFELAALLLPQLPAYGLVAVAEALGLPPASGEQHRAGADVDLTRRVFARLWERLLEFEAETLAEVVRLTAGTGWPLHPLFVEAQRSKTRESFGASLGGALRAALRVAPDAPAGEMAYLLPRSRPEPLEPTGNTTPIDLPALEEALQPGSPFARQFPDFEPRPQQLQMLREVGRAFNEAERLLVEAGTGTGKSLAYLLPAVAVAVRRGEAVVISTKTIQLQDQLFHKDIPTVRAALAALADGAEEGRRETLPTTFKAALVKGRSNYLCLRRWFALRRGETLPKEEVRTLVKILLWLQSTDTGDRAELRLLPGEEVTWARVMATPDACAPATCPFNRRGQCYLYRARRAAEAAHIVVVNHALLLSDMATSSQILPPYNHLVVDEAHRLEDEATAQLGYSVDRRTVVEALDGLVRGAGSRQEGLIPDILTALRVSKVPTATRGTVETIANDLTEAVAAARRAAADLFERIERFVESPDSGQGAEGYDPRLRLTPAVRAREGWAVVETLWEGLSGPLARVNQGLSDLAAQLERLEASRVTEYETLVGDVATAQRATIELRLHLNATIANPDPGMVYWAETNRAQHSAALHAAPLHVGSTLALGLYEGRQTLVLTSATLTTEGRFDYVRERLNLPDARGVQLGSPFDYRRATLLYLADDLPEPGRPGYQKRLEAGIIDLCLATGGRALALFTSHSALRQTYMAIKGPLEAKGILVLAQRIDGSPRHLVERLRATGKAVILGTASFWEGVDVVGEALSVLIITKLPFQVPSDPVFAARCEQFDNPFPEFAVPQTVLTFKQGFGRLIRSRSDRGVVAVLDRRLLSKSYGRSFLNSLPECTQRQGRLGDLPRLARSWLTNAHEAARIAGLPPEEPAGR